MFLSCMICCGDVCGLGEGGVVVIMDGVGGFKCCDSMNEYSEVSSGVHCSLDGLSEDSDDGEGGNDDSLSKAVIVDKVMAMCSEMAITSRLCFPGQCGN